ncbi:hypothetical protein CesoFtcFv8_004437 [Champsocephalus esox]|uniref:Uncharacterized protein n=1 Tax=Champsocephalus esox TaxID=159716 RepID=A0AAN8CUF4_9TELE|nr:hypothetical protein CesoFtcFv8_004437 [Champsocephalus esox]
MSSRAESKTASQFVSLTMRLKDKLHTQKIRRSERIKHTPTYTAALQHTHQGVLVEQQRDVVSSLQYFKALVDKLVVDRSVGGLLGGASSRVLEAVKSLVREGPQQRDSETVSSCLTRLYLSVAQLIRWADHVMLQGVAHSNKESTASVTTVIRVVLDGVKELVRLAAERQERLRPCVSCPITGLRGTGGRGAADLRQEVYPLESRGGDLRQEVYLLESRGGDLRQEVYLLESRGADLRQEVYLLESRGGDLRQEVYLLESRDSDRKSTAGVQRRRPQTGSLPAGVQRRDLRQEVYLLSQRPQQEVYLRVRARKSTCWSPEEETSDRKSTCWSPETSDRKSTCPEEDQDPPSAPPKPPKPSSEPRPPLPPPQGPSPPALPPKQRHSLSPAPCRIAIVAPMMRGPAADRQVQEENLKRSPEETHCEDDPDYHFLLTETPPLSSLPPVLPEKKRCSTEGSTFSQAPSYFGFDSAHCDDFTTHCDDVTGPDDVTSSPLSPSKTPPPLPEKKRHIQQYLQFCSSYSAPSAAVFYQRPLTFSQRYMSQQLTQLDTQTSDSNPSPVLPPAPVLPQKKRQQADILKRITIKPQEEEGPQVKAASAEILLVHATEADEREGESPF